MKNCKDAQLALYAKKVLHNRMMDDARRFRVVRAIRGAAGRLSW